MRAHHHQPLRKADDLLHHPPLHRVGFGQDGVQRRHDRHPQFGQQRDDEAARPGAEDPVLVLERHGVHGGDVEEVHRPAIRPRVILLDREPDLGGIDMPPTGIVHREDEAAEGRILVRDGGAEVGGERGYAALPGQMVAEERDGLEGRRCGD